MRDKVAVLGLDGASKELILYGIENGYLPTIKHLYTNNLFIIKNMDCIPPLTFPSWTSIETGVNPGKHGIFDFFEYHIINNNNWEAKLVSSLDLEHPRFHEMIHLLKGRTKTLIVNIVPPYPLLPTNNTDILQLGFFTPKILYYPKSLGDIYAEEINAIKELKFHLTSGCEALDKAIDLLNIYQEILNKSLVRTYDLIWFLIQIPDAVLHKCHEAARKPAMLNKIFQEIDKIIRTIIAYYENLIIVSDHGFKYYNKRLSINKIFYDEGLIKKAKRNSEIINETYTQTKLKQIKISGTLYKMLTFQPIRPITKTVYRIIRKLVAKKGYGLTVIYETGVDYNNSYAFIPADKSSTPPRFYILIKRNDPSIIEKIKRILQKYGLETHDPKEIFHGPYVDKAPGLIIVPKPDLDYWFIPGTIYTSKIIKRGVANHSRYGVFGIYSKNLDLDLFNQLPDPIPNTLPAPIILNILGYPISDQTDHIELVKQLFPNTKTINVLKKWQLYKKLYRLRTKKPRQSNI